VTWLLFAHCDGASRDLHSFPTRRSSDLLPVDVAPPEAERWGQGGRRIPVYVGTGPNGRALCNWCAVEVTPPRRKWCSDDCRETADRKSTRLNSSHVKISYAVFCLKKQRT